MDAVIAKEFSQFGKRGFWSYIKLSVKNYFNYSSGITTIEIDGEEKQFENTLFVSLANTSEFGNRFQIAPNNNHQDGKFELVVFRKPPLLIIPFTIIRFFTRSVRNSKYVSHFEGSEAKITNPKAIQKDGDWIDERIENIDVKIIKNAIKIVC